MEDNPHISLNVKLNVGGSYFTTSVQTLTKDPNTMLAAMFSGKFEMKPCEDGAFFIDRDGTHFRFILNYLRTGKLTLPEGATFLKELQEEAEFYQIQGMLEELKSRLNTSTSSSRSTSVKLNVGGEFFTTSVQTLTRDPSSILAAMFSTERHLDPFFDLMEAKPQPLEDGSFFIDRDGKHFRILLNYLRNRKELILPEDANDTFLKELEAEAKFYKIRGAINQLNEIIVDRGRKAVRARLYQL